MTPNIRMLAEGCLALIIGISSVPDFFGVLISNRKTVGI